MSRALTARPLQIKSWTPMVQRVANFNKKPRWVPVAKSRIYYIPKKPVVPEEEKLELKRIADNYHTQMRAVRFYYHEQMLHEKQSQLNTTSNEYFQQEQLDLERCIMINEEWNAERAKEREARLQELHEKMENNALTLIELKDKKRAEAIEKANILIRKEKEASKTFITADTLEAAIEHALANPTDYNYAIDSEGNRYAGRETNSTLAKQGAAS